MSLYDVNRLSHTCSIFETCHFDDMFKFLYQ